MSVKTGENAVTSGLDHIGTRISQLLHHFNAFVTDGDDSGFTDKLVVEFHALFEIELHVDENQVHSAPIHRDAQDVLEIAAPTVIEIVALCTIVDVHKRVQITHPHLDRHGELIGVGLHLWF